MYFEEYRLLWMNAYFPTDPQTNNYDDTELLEVLGETLIMTREGILALLE